MIIAAIVLITIDLIAHTVLIAYVAVALRPRDGWNKTLREGIEHKKRYYA